MNDLLQRLQQLSPAKRELVLKKLQAQKLALAPDDHPQEPPLRPIPRDQPLPLSFAQQRLWVLDQLEGGRTATYNMPAALRLAGPLNLSALQQSLAQIVQRHGVLRTTFPQVDGTPRQRVGPDRDVPLPVVDLQHLSEAEQTIEVRRRALAEAQRPFNLAQGPLLRLTLLRLGPEAHVLLVTLHHIVADGWSVGIFVKEAVTLYDSLVTGQPADLPKLPLQYVDFAYWQRQWLQGEVLDRLLTYWQKELADAPTRLDLPTDHPRPPRQSFRGNTEQFTLDPDTTAALKGLSREANTTLFMTLLAAFATLLSHYSRQEDIVVGSPVANRNRREIEGLIGFFVNVLALRIDLSGRPTFKTLLSRVQEVTLAAYQHQDMPFEQILHNLDLPPDISRPPLVQVAFALDNTVTPPLDLTNLTVTPLDLPLSAAKTDITLMMRAESGRLGGRLEYCVDLFEPTTMRRFVAHFEKLVGVIIANPDQTLPDLIKEAGLVRSGLIGGSTRPEALADLLRRSNLTEHQLLIWLDQKLNPDTPIYNNAGLTRLAPETDLNLLQTAFQTVINSSDALRTIIVETDEAPRRQLLPPFPYRAERLDFSQTPDPATHLQNWAKERTQIPFNLEQPLFEVVFIKISGPEIAGYFKIHQLISDALSLALLVHYSLELYAQARQGAPLPEHIDLPQFQAYLADEREYRRSALYARAKAYIEEQFDRNPAPLTFYGRPALKQSTYAERVSRSLGDRRTEQLRAVAGQFNDFGGNREANLTAIFLTLLAVYLYRISGSRHLVIGIPVHNRLSKSFQRTIGSFMQIFPVQITVEPDDTFASLHPRTVAAMYELFRHGRCAVRNPLQTPLYDVVLNYHLESLSAGSDVSVTLDWIHPGHARESLTVQIRDLASTRSLDLDFDLHCDVFPGEIRPLAVGHFLQVIEAFLSDSTQAIGTVNLLSPAEQKRILFDFNQTQTAFPTDQSFDQLFARQVRQTPERIAVIEAGRSLTYAQLNRQANQLAHYLRSIGVKPEVIVGVCMDRSIEMLVSILAIFKAGGVYLPVEPTLPPERLSFVLADSGTKVLLTTARRAGVVAQEQLQLICLDTAGETLARQKESNPAGSLMPENLAYVIYTSGSTGLPKGVMIEHRGMVNHLYGMILDLDLTAADRIAQTAPQGFDISIWQFLAALLAGGAVVIFDDEATHNPARMFEEVVHQEISILEVVPSLFGLMLEEVGRPDSSPPDLAKLRWLLLTGEALPPQLCRQWFEFYPTIPLINAYGPAECSDDVTLYPIYRPPAADTTHIPIGRAVANTRLYVLDSHFLPVPVGVAGELCVGGAGVGRGYLNDPDRTAASFGADPFSEEVGARLYKTGDLACYRPDGNILFLGRLDHQVKIRGFRIELGEIEAVLDQHPAVQASVVMAREDQPGDKRLVAYVAAKAGSAGIDAETRPATLPDSLRTLARTKLPDYMVPATFVVLESLPLTPNGKVDRRALPAPDLSDLQVTSGHLSPRDPVEQQLADIWQEVLDLAAIGVRDSFFDLGGHSLLAIRLMVKIEQQFNRQLPLAALFQNPTIEALAAVLRQDTEGDNKPWSPLVPLQPAGQEPPFFCFPPGNGDVLCYRELARRLGSKRPVYGLQPPGLDGQQAPFERIEDLAAYYAEAIQTRQPRGPYYLGGWSMGGVVAFELAQQLQRRGEKVARLVVIDSQIWSRSAVPEWVEQALMIFTLTDSLEKIFGKKLKIPLEQLRSFTWGEQIGYVFNLAQEAEMPSPDEAPQIRQLLKLFRTNQQAARRYLPRPYSGALTLFTAAERIVPGSPDPSLGWAKLVHGALDVHQVPGTHFTMLQEPYVEILAKQLKTCLMTPP